MCSPPLDRRSARSVEAVEVEAEFRAQLDRFTELVGFPPANVNAHHHVHVFQRVVNALTEVLAGLPTRPFLRRVVEDSDRQQVALAEEIEFLQNRQQGRARMVNSAIMPLIPGRSAQGNRNRVSAFRHCHPHPVVEVQLRGPRRRPVW